MSLKRAEVCQSVLVYMNTTSCGIKRSILEPTRKFELIEMLLLQIPDKKNLTQYRKANQSINQSNFI